MSWSNLWAFILGCTLFMLGIDSSFSAIEATSTVLCDTTWGKHYPRMFVAFVLCLIGFLGSIPFCMNFGFLLFDVVDHYLTAYLLNLIGILQAFGCGWFFDVAPTMAKSEAHSKSLLFLSFSYWGGLLTTALITTIMDEVQIGFIVFGIIFVISSIVSFVISGLPFWTFYEEVYMCGVRKIGYACSQMGRFEKSKKQWWEPAFVFYWGVLIKFVNPCLLTFILFGIMKTDLTKPYGDYPAIWQVIGWTIPIIGLLCFIIPIFFCISSEELDYSEFELFDQMDATQLSNKISAEP